MFCREEAAQLRELNRLSKDLGSSLIIIGNGSPEEAAAFQEDLLEGEVQLLTDPSLTSYKAMQLKRSLFASVKPRTFLRALSLRRKGGRGAHRQGDSIQQGGAFVITPDHRVPYSYFCQVPEDHADPEEILATLRNLSWRSATELTPR